VCNVLLFINRKKRKKGYGNTARGQEKAERGKDRFDKARAAGATNVGGDSGNAQRTETKGEAQIWKYKNENLASGGRAF